MEPVTLPFYTSHKTVQAGIIRELRPVQTAMEGTPVITDLVVAVGDEKTIIRVSAEYVGKHKPQVGGYYVKYADGYESWSPADVFEGGYKLQPRDFKERVEAEHIELNERLRKLQLFMDGDTFKTLPQDERDRLARQEKAMNEYSLVLLDRRAAHLAPASEPVTVVFPGSGPVVPPPGVLVEPEPDAPAAETAVLAEPVGNAVPVAATEAAGEAPAETPAE